MKLRLAPLAVAVAMSLPITPVFARGPDLARCPVSTHTADSEVQRTAPLEIPSDLRGLVKADRYRLGILTQSGTTFCSDTGSIESIENMELSPDGRFLTYGWYGYEVYGYELMDRTGSGALHEIGARPVFSPSRHLFAAVDQTESEFGTLSGLAVWRAGPALVRQEATVADIPRMNNWRIDGWTGENCIALSAIPQQRTPEDPKDWGKARRDRFIATSTQGRWTLKRAKACPPK